MPLKVSHFVFARPVQALQIALPNCFEWPALLKDPDERIEQYEEKGKVVQCSGLAKLPSRHTIVVFHISIKCSCAVPYLCTTAASAPPAITFLGNSHSRIVFLHRPRACNDR